MTYTVCSSEYWTFTYLLAFELNCENAKTYRDFLSSSTLPSLYCFIRFVNISKFMHITISCATHWSEKLSVWQKPMARKLFHSLAYTVWWECISWRHGLLVPNSNCLPAQTSYYTTSLARYSYENQLGHCQPFLPTFLSDQQILDRYMKYHLLTKFSVYLSGKLSNPCSLSISVINSLIKFLISLLPPLLLDTCLLKLIFQLILPTKYIYCAELTLPRRSGYGICSA